MVDDVLLVVIETKWICSIPYILSLHHNNVNGAILLKALVKVDLINIFASLARQIIHL